MEDLGKFVWSLVLMTISMLAGGFVTMKLWNWLLVPALEVNVLSYGYGVGVGVFLAFMKMKVPEKDEESLDISESNARLGRVLIIYSLFLLIGWVVSLFL